MHSHPEQDGKPEEAASDPIHRYPQHDDKPEEAARDLKPILIGAAVVAALALLVVLHLIGVFGPNSHQ